MRIALFTETFLPNVDGVVNTLCRLLHHLSDHGHESILFAPEGGPLRFANTPIVGLPGIPFPAYPELKLVPPISNVKDRLIAFKPDIIHTLSPVLLGVLGVRQAYAMQLPLIASYHTDVPGFAIRWGLGLWHGPLVGYLRWIHNKADKTLCPSKATMDLLESQGYQRLGIWSRGVDSEFFSPQHRSTAMRRRLSDGEADRPLLLYVGRLSLEKRVEWLKHLLDGIPQARLAIVGDGPIRKQLEQEFACYPVHFAGFMHGDELAAAYASADLFTFPSANETLGNVVLEAMSSGLPVVAPRSGGVVDHIRDGETGLLFDSESRKDWVNTVNLLVGHPELARQMGARGRLLMETRSWASVMDDLMFEYETLIGSKNVNSHMFGSNTRLNLPASSSSLQTRDRWR